MVARKTYRFEVEYQVTVDGGGKSIRTRKVDLFTEYRDWTREDYDKLEKYLETLERKDNKRPCVVAIISARRVTRRKYENIPAQKRLFNI